MKTLLKFVFVILSIGMVLPVIAQSTELSPNTISVYGSAEKVLEPDMIVISLTMQEYTDNTTGMKKMIEQLEEELLQLAKTVGVANDAVLINNVNGYSDYGGYDGAAEFMVSKTYQITLNSRENLDALLTKIDGQGLTNVSITQFSHSKLDEYRDELKGQAIANAKREAEILLESTGKSLGELAGIEVYTDYSNAYFDGYSPFIGELPASYNGKVALKPITLRYGLRVMFEIE
jgi:hypothetical protein